MLSGLTYYPSVLRRSRIAFHQVTACHVTLSNRLQCFYKLSAVACFSRQTRLITSSSCSRRLWAGQAGGYRAHFRSRSKLQSGNSGWQWLAVPFPSLPCPAQSARLSYHLKLSTLSAAASLWVTAHWQWEIGVTITAVVLLNSTRGGALNPDSPSLYLGVTAECVEDQRFKMACTY